MTRLILVRHGESCGNKLHRFYGHFDGDLTELGKAQADKTGEFLKDYKIDAAYASDLKRAYETGCRIASYHVGLEVIPDKNLREIFAGEWENGVFEELAGNYPEEFDRWRNDIWNSRPTGGESVKELTKRVGDELWKIARENEGKTVLVATHATPIRSQVCAWQGVPNENMTQFPWVKNASVTIVDYDTENNSTSVVVLGEVSFMEDLATALPPNV